MGKTSISTALLAVFVFLVCSAAFSGEEKSYRLVVEDRIETIQGAYDTSLRRAETSDEVMDAGIKQFLELEKLAADVLAKKQEQYADRPELVEALQKSFDATVVLRLFLRKRIKDDLNFGSPNIRDARSLEVDSELSIMNIRQMLTLY